MNIRCVLSLLLDTSLVWMLELGVTSQTTLLLENAPVVNLEKQRKTRFVFLLSKVEPFMRH